VIAWRARSVKADRKVFELGLFVSMTEATVEDLEYLMCPLEGRDPGLANIVRAGIPVKKEQSSHDSIRKPLVKCGHLKDQISLSILKVLLIVPRLQVGKGDGLDRNGQDKTGPVSCLGNVHFLVSESPCNSLLATLFLPGGGSRLGVVKAAPPELRGDDQSKLPGDNLGVVLLFGPPRRLVGS
jgi:hypothetical protein